jgi:hypothetical protein
MVPGPPGKVDGSATTGTDDPHHALSGRLEVPMSRTCSLFLVLSLVACGQEAAPTPQAAAPAEPAPKEEASPAVPAPKPEPAAPAVDDGGPLGVAACDEYLAAYRACVAETLPAELREHHTAVVDGQRRAWGRAKADAKVDLAEACTTARAAAKLGLPGCKQL